MRSVQSLLRYTYFINLTLNVIKRKYLLSRYMSICCIKRLYIIWNLKHIVVFVVNSFKKKGFAQNYETRDKITVGSIYRTQHSSWDWMRGWRGWIKKVSLRRKHYILCLFETLLLCFLGTESNCFWCKIYNFVSK